MFRIIPDRRRKIIKVESSGLGTVDEVKSFRRDLETTLHELGWAPCDYGLLLHTLDTVVQTQGVMETLTASLHDETVRARRVAVVKGGALAGMQTRRVLDEHSALFNAVPDAERWLAA